MPIEVPILVQYQASNELGTHTVQRCPQAVSLSLANVIAGVVVVGVHRGELGAKLASGGFGCEYHTTIAASVNAAAAIDRGVADSRRVDHQSSRPISPARRIVHRFPYAAGTANLPALWP